MITYKVFSPFLENTETVKSEFFMTLYKNGILKMIDSKTFRIGNSNYYIKRELK